MSVEPLLSILRKRITIFAFGFAFGAAFMASPAIGLLLAVAAAFYLVVFRY